MINSDQQFRSSTARKTLLLLGRDDFIPDCNLIALRYQFPDVVVQHVAGLSGLQSISSAAVVLTDEAFLVDLSQSEEFLIRQLRHRVVAVLDETALHFSPATYRHVLSNLVTGVLSMNLRLEVWLTTVGLFLHGAEFVPSSLVRAHSGESKELKSSEANIAALTEREWQVLQMLSLGGSNRVIALRFKLSEHTIKVHVHNIIKKLKASNRTAAAAIFFKGNKYRAAAPFDEAPSSKCRENA